MVAHAENTVIQPEMTDVEEVVECLVEELLGSPPESPTRLELTQAMTAGATPADAQPADPAPSPPKPATCPLCKRSGIPAEILPGGRVRCTHCDSLFLAAPSAPAITASFTTERKRMKSPMKTQVVDDEETSFTKKWQKPVLLAAASLAVIAVLYFWFPSNMKTSRMAVFPAQGKATYLGNPIPNAAVFLHPIGVKADFPLPRAIVKGDGSFVIGTYGADDGAPAGEYRVTTQWFEKVEDPEKDDGISPRNQLPAKYARVETSGLSLRIQEGENIIPPLQLTH